jgi:hypothetical protein
MEGNLNLKQFKFKMRKNRIKLLAAPVISPVTSETKKGFLNLKQFKFKTSFEPLVAPEPLVKPGPSTVPKPEIIPQQDPDEDSPWNVPGPKVDPTPKGKNSF